MIRRATEADRQPRRRRELSDSHPIGFVREGIREAVEYRRSIRFSSRDPESSTEYVGVNAQPQRFAVAACLHVAKGLLRR